MITLQIIVFIFCKKPIQKQTSRFSFDVISLNVKGLRNSNKRNVVFNWLNDHTSDHCVYFLQETHSIKDDESLWMKELKCDQIYFSHGENNARGTFHEFRIHSRE